MIICLVNMKTKPGQRNAFLSEIYEAGIIERFHTEVDGNEIYEYYCDPMDEDRMLLIDAYRDQESYERHLDTAAFKAWLPIFEKHVDRESVTSKRYHTVL